MLRARFARSRRHCIPCLKGYLSSHEQSVLTSSCPIRIHTIMQGLQKTHVILIWAINEEKTTTWGGCESSHIGCAHYTSNWRNHVRSLRLSWISPIHSNPKEGHSDRKTDSTQRSVSFELLMLASNPSGSNRETRPSSFVFASTLKPPMKVMMDLFDQAEYALGGIDLWVFINRSEKIKLTAPEVSIDLSSMLSQTENCSFVDEYKREHDTDEDMRNQK